MKKTAKALSLFLILFTCFGVTAAAQNKKADKDTRNWVYEIEPVGVGTQGSYLIKVWSYSKKPIVAIEQAKKNAVHGIIFKGFTGIQGVPGQRPLTNNPNLEVEQAEFFKNFFAEGGKYMKFVNITNDGSVAAEDRLKIGKEYKIGVVVSVNVAGLRKDLEDAGILRGLSSGF
ncbi:MAG TPA: hypothetical protein PLH52_08065 [Paludibacteraceae bacterium]|jgi:hypothetical protein|nr:hypothetical protein [Paludibacteraceae bacterium]